MNLNLRGFFPEIFAFPFPGAWTCDLSRYSRKSYYNFAYEMLFLGNLLRTTQYVKKNSRSFIE